MPVNAEKSQFTADVARALRELVDMGEQLWMFYTGDGLGNTGVGLATLDKDELRP